MLKYLHLYLPPGKFVTNGLKALLAAGFTVVLAWQLTYRLEGLPLAEALADAVTGVNVWWLTLAVLLTVGNWGIEAFKWQRMAAALQPVGYVDALRATLYALSVGFITPNRVGEWVGKVSVFENGKRTDGVALSLMASCAQLMVTLVVGCAALICLSSFSFSLPGNLIFHQAAFIAGIGGALLLIVYLFWWRGNVPWLHVLSRISFLKRASAAPPVHTKLLLETVALSAMRYVVFSVQFLLLLAAFGCALPLVESALLVSVVFFYLTWLPVPTAAEPGLRGNVALFFLTPLIPHPVGIVCAATLLWIVNLMLPALAGAVWFLTDKRV